jgi:hypothetical protein
MLGELLYPLVKDLAKDKSLAPKITGITGKINFNNNAYVRERK